MENLTLYASPSVREINLQQCSIVMLLDHVADIIIKGRIFSFNEYPYFVIFVETQKKCAIAKSIYLQFSL